MFGNWTTAMLARHTHPYTVHGRSGLKITAGQRTLSGLIADFTGQTAVSPVILTGHFWIQTFYFPYSCCLMLDNAAMISLAFFAALL